MKLSGFLTVILLLTVVQASQAYIQPIGFGFLTPIMQVRLSFYKQKFKY